MSLSIELIVMDRENVTKLCSEVFIPSPKVPRIGFPDGYVVLYLDDGNHVLHSCDCKASACERQFYNSFQIKTFD